MKTIAILNTKGGVGKTNTTRNIGRCLQKQGHQVVLGDTDPQKCLMEWRLKNVDNDQPCVVEIRSKADLLQTIADYEPENDFLVVDGLAADFQLTLAALKAADLVVLPFQASPDDMAFLEELVDLVKMVQTSRGDTLQAAFLLSNIDDGTVLLDVATDLLKEYHAIPLLDASIGHRQAYRKSAAAGGTVFDYFNDKKAQSEVNAVTGEILAMMEVIQKEVAHA
ncbi:MAG: AAA family ATPase [Gammaproteobacteria bacterium]|nr:AAA family ATPase [Gammaproteobacteria bacterium]